MLDHNSPFYLINSGKWSYTLTRVLGVTVGEVVRMKEQISDVILGITDPENGFLIGKINPGPADPG